MPRETLQRFLDLPEKCAHSETSAGFDRPPEDAMTLSTVEAGDKIFARCSAQACAEAAMHLLCVCKSFVQRALLGRWEMRGMTYRKPGSQNSKQEASALTFLRSGVWAAGFTMAGITPGRSSASRQQSKRTVAAFCRSSSTTAIAIMTSVRQI